MAKIERGHNQDISDVKAMFGDGLVEPEKLRTLFLMIESELYRYPAIDPISFSKNVDNFVERFGSKPNV